MGHQSVDKKYIRKITKILDTWREMGHQSVDKMWDVNMMRVGDLLLYFPYFIKVITNSIKAMTSELQFALVFDV